MVLGSPPARVAPPAPARQAPAWGLAAVPALRATPVAPVIPAMPAPPRPAGTAVAGAVVTVEEAAAVWWRRGTGRRQPTCLRRRCPRPPWTRRAAAVLPAVPAL